ncbi:MAG: substrate-binding domain-containing protein [Fidelibacterota bacterium]|nr:MAG: substrate-binding domain-containing protein [Candidatus Neomarinimicrobiota bacterium]
MLQPGYNHSANPDGSTSSLSRILIYLIGAAVLGLIIWLGRGVVRPSQPQTILLYCFTGMQEVMERGIFPAFRDYWEDQNGVEMEFIPTFAGSGSIVDKVIARVPADVVILASEMDGHRLATKALTTVAAWKQLPNMGICCRTALVILARDSDYVDIRGFEDLSEPGLDVILSHPRTSGIGEWSLLAIYGSALGRGYDHSGALAQLADVWRNVTSAPSAQAALRRFAEGEGSVVLAYEANVLPTPQRRRPPGQMVQLGSTTLCEPIVVVLEQNIAEDRRELVHSFVQFLWREEVQRVFVEYGFRSLSDSLNRTRADFPRYSSLVTMESLGGATVCRQQILEPFLTTIAAESSAD